MSVPAYRAPDIGLASWECIPREPLPYFGNLAKAAAIGAAALLTTGSTSLLLRHGHQPTAVKMSGSHSISTLPSFFFNPDSAATTAPHTTTTKAKLNAEQTTPSPTRRPAKKTTITISRQKPVSPITTSPKQAHAIHAASLSLPSTNYIVDVSWPNCGISSLTLASAKTVIVGVNHGLPDNLNNDGVADDTSIATPKPSETCFKKEISPAKKLELYVNSAAPLRDNEFAFARQPGNPIPCGQNLDQCGEAYGYASGKADANFVMNKQNDLSKWDRMIWIDVENCYNYQCWNTVDLNENVQTIKGEEEGLRAGFQKLGYITIGFYTDSYQWNKIMDMSSPYLKTIEYYPMWIPTGQSTSADAQLHWSDRKFNQGGVEYIQYTGQDKLGYLDYDEAPTT